MASPPPRNPSAEASAFQKFLREREEAHEAALDIRAASDGDEPGLEDAAAGIKPSLQQQVPLQRLPDAKGAERRFIESATESFGKKQAFPDAASSALTAARNIKGKPDPIPEDPTLAQQAARTLMPKRRVTDLRPETLALQTARNAAAVVDPFRLNPLLNKLTETPREEELGIREENAVMWVMRVFGSVAPALITETVERTPTPGVTGAVEAANEGAFDRIAEEFFTASTLGKEVLGVEPGFNQKVRRGTGADWAQGVLERVERGAGFEEDMEAAFKTRLGDEWGNTGWYLGLALDMGLNWEGALAKGPRSMASIARRAKDLGDLAPDASMLNRFVGAVRNNELDMGELAGARNADRVESGDMGLDDLPPAIRARLEEVALNEESVAARELFVEEGFTKGLDDAPVDEAFIRAREELADAKGLGLDGVEPGVFTERRKVKRKGKAADEREDLPPFGPHGRLVSSAAEWWREVTEAFRKGPKGGYKLKRYAGFNRFAGSADMTPDKPRYVLRTKDGDVRSVGAFDEVVEEMLSRPKDGDEIWWGNARPVARWRKTDKAILSSDRLFASPVERAIVQQLRSTDIRAIPGRLRGELNRLSAERAAGRVIAEATLGPPAGRTVPTTRSGQAVLEATRLAFRDIMDSTRFKQLPNTAIVAKADHKRILQATDKAMGVSVDRARQLIGGAEATAEEAAHLGALSRRFGVDLEGGLSTRDWMDLRNAVMGEVGGVIADVRYRVQGTQGFVDRLFGVLQDASLDRRKMRGIGAKLVKNGPMSLFARGFLEDKLARLPGPVKSKLKELWIKLERNSDDLLTEFQRAEGQTVSARLLAVLGRYSVTHPADLDRARSVLAKTGEGVFEDVARNWRGHKPTWLTSTSEAARRAGLFGWARDTESAAADIGRKWVSSNLVAAGQDMQRTGLRRRLMEDVPDDVAITAYRELTQEGKLSGPGLNAALDRLNVGPLKLDSEEALLTHALQMRTEATVAEVMDELMGRVAVRSSDPRLPALNAVLFDQHRSWNHTAGRYDYRYPEGQIAWAHSTLRDWGVDPGSGAALKDTRIGRQEVHVPKYLSDYLERMVSSGQIDSRTVTGRKSLDILMRSFKEWTTHGVIVPNFAYYTGQLLSVAPTLVTSRGLAGTVGAGSTLMRNPVIVGRLVRRLAKGGGPDFRARIPEGNLIQTATGEWWSIDDLEEAARRFGLQDNPTAFETAPQLRAVIAREGADYATLDPRRIVKATAWWQQLLREAAGGIDQTARMSVFVDEIRKGTPAATAAQIAREALLDFRNLTEFESKWMRMTFTFYAFMRKNADNYIRALFHHPERVMGQMRMAHSSLTNSGLDDLELGAQRPEDVTRMTLYTDEEVVNDEGRVHRLYRQNRLQSTPMGVGEWVNQMLRLLAPVTNLAGPGVPPGVKPSDLLGDVSPLWSTIALLTQGRKLDRDITSPRSNRIPPVLMDFPGIGPLFMETFGVGPVPIGADEDFLLADDDASFEFGSGEPAVWVAGGDRSLTPEQAENKRIRYQAFMTWFSRPVGSLQSYAEAIGASEVDPNLTSDEAMWPLLGLKMRPALRTDEVIRRSEADLERQFKSAEKEVRVPDRSIGRPPR